MTQTGPGRLVARTPDDLLAMVPTVLGFVPTESVTMLTFDAELPFHARVDLPDVADDDPGLVAALLEPSRRHGVRLVAFVVHSTRADRFRAAAGALLDAFCAAGIGVADVLRADGRRRWCLHCVPDQMAATGVDRGPCAGHTYDVGAHRFAVQAVVAGRVVHRSRDDLAATLVPDAATAARQAVVRDAALRHASGLGAADLTGEATWLRRSLRRHLAEGSRPDDVRLGRLLADLCVVALRDPCWEQMDTGRAREHVELWRDVVRRAPADLLGAPAGVLGFAAWLAGDGALAWCAVDRGRAEHGDLDLLGFVAELLTRAVPPSSYLPGHVRSAPSEDLAGGGLMA